MTIASALLQFLTRLLERGCSQDESAHALLTGQLEETYGGGDLLRRKLEALRRQCALFLETYGDGPVHILRAPARINLLGEHVDYVSYLPTASLTFGSREHEMILFFRPSADGRVRGITTLPDCDSLDFALEDAPAGSGVCDDGHEWTHFLYLRPPRAAHWGNYVRGATFFARIKHGDRIRNGFDFLVDSSIPSAGGASSSSALTVLAGAAIRHANRLHCDLLELARDSAKAEWFIGTRGGTMDHLTMCLSRQGHLVHIAYQKSEPDLLPMDQTLFRIATFYAHPADKSREVMIEYNERAAVARILIPAIIEDWAVSRPALYSSWHAALAASAERSPAGQLELGEILSGLPETMSLAEMRSRYPAAFGACAEAFDALVRERLHQPLPIRDRALHHLGEVRRVAEAGRLLRSMSGLDIPGEPVSGMREAGSGGSGPVRRLGPAPEEVEEVMRRIGELLNESHCSLRDLYGVSTPSVERLVETVLSDSRVYGARLMGGGFGGNVLALAAAEHVPELVRRVQERFFAPEGRAGAVMISTAGNGLGALGTRPAARRAVVRFNENWRSATQEAAAIRALIRRIEPGLPPQEIQVVILAAGKGKRARKSGLQAPKPLAPVLGVPAVVRVLRSIRGAFSLRLPPIVIVSPDTEQGVSAALKGEDVRFVLQARALGTGDAILCAGAHLRDFCGRTLVVWGTQPVIQTDTVRLALDLAALFPDFEMILPSTVMERPYAPLYRDARARISAAHETHLEHMHVPEFGETNIGLFLLWNQTMLAELKRLHESYWRESEGCYDRPRGELGFPNELIRALASKSGGILACPLADWREEKGIKNKADVVRCEQYLRELGTG